MISKELKSLLEGLDLLSNKAVFFSNKEDGQTFSAFPLEIQKKIEIINPNAFFVFNNQPYILFFDLTEDKGAEREQEIHKQVWSFDYSPIAFIIKHNEVQIFNAFNYNRRTNRLQEIDISESEINERFSFWNLQSGESWRWLQVKEYKNNIQRKRVNQRLFENIKAVRSKLIENGLQEDDANILILRIIFIRYLIDRNVDIDNTYITGKTPKEKRQSLLKLFQSLQLLNGFFKYLNIRFNGVLFKDTSIKVSQDNLLFLSAIFDSRKDKVSPSLSENFYFDVFDFSIIPVEVISGIYESLIDKETRKLHSAVYTPSFLVEYILTETVDKYLEKNKTSECKIFDPSCGSGIFLVQSLRRMIDKEIILYSNKIKSKKFSERIREIAKNNLFGVDINPQALNVTCFSIYVALLDYQEPKDIDTYQFPNLLNENFFEANFFEENDNHPLNTIIRKKNFDFILGNPPWRSNKDEKHLTWLKENKKVTGRYEIAQSFLLRSKDFMQIHTVSALIVTSTIFYNISNTTKEFKRDFLTQFCLDRFFDLSPVRRLIFEEKNNPASIIFYRLSDGKNYLTNIVKHLSLKYNIFLKYFKTLIIEKFDQKEIQQKYFLENDWMFKVALYGNTLDFFFLKRIEQNSKRIRDFIDNKTIFKGAGILEGDKSLYSQYPPIIGKDLIQNGEVSLNYTISHSSKKVSAKDSHLKSGRIEGLFEGRQILFKEQAKDESDIIVSYTHSTYVFKKGIFGISSLMNQDKIKELYAYLISKLYSYYIFIISGSWGVSTRPQIRWDEEYLAFPISIPDKKTQKELVSLVNDYLKPYEVHYKQFLLGEPQKDEFALYKINDIIEELYKVKKYEKDLIDYVLNVSRYQFQENKQHRVTQFNYTDENDPRNRNKVLKEFAGIFLNEFEKVYTNEYIQVDVYILDHFIAMNFSFLKEKPSNKPQINIDIGSNDIRDLFSKISDLSISKIVSSTNPEYNLFIQKDIKGFEQSSFYIVKPNEYKCWHRAMAWYDISEIKEAIQRAELEYIKEEVHAS